MTGQELIDFIREYKAENAVFVFPGIIEIILGRIKSTDATLSINQINEIGQILSDYEIMEKNLSVALIPEDDNVRIIERFIAAKNIEGLTRGTLNFYLLTIKSLLEIINKQLVAMTTDDIRRYLTKKSINGCGKVTLNNYRRNLNSFFAWMVAEDIIVKNPMLRIKSIKIDKIIKEPFSEEEIEALRAACLTLRDKAMVEFLYSTGVRVSELARINRSDIDFYNSSVKVKGKGGKERYVYLNGKCKYSLQKYIENRADNNEALFTSLSEPNNRLNSGGIEYRLRRLGVMAGVAKTHPHRFRRTAATTALNRGMPIDQVQQLLGHSKIETTTIYAKADDDNIRMSHKKFLS